MDDLYFKWAQIVIERWQEKITKLQIVDSGALVRSFTSQVILDAAGNPEKIVFTYLYYGIFSDMGVTRGIKLNDPRAKARQRPWYKSVFYKELNKLARLMAEKYSIDAASIAKAIEGRVANNLTR